jgi:hypothetical protein
VCWQILATLSLLRCAPHIPRDKISVCALSLCSLLLRQWFAISVSSSIKLTHRGAHCERAAACVYSWMDWGSFKSFAEVNKREDSTSNHVTTQSGCALFRHQFPSRSLSLSSPFVPSKNVSGWLGGLVFRLSRGTAPQSSSKSGTLEFDWSNLSQTNLHIY